MDGVAAYREAQEAEELARLRRLVALRAMVASGASQRQIADRLGVSQPAISQQLRSAALDSVPPERLIEAAAPILVGLAEDHGYARLSVFGSVARREAGPESDIDLIVEAPPGTSTFDFVRFQRLIEEVVGRDVDLVDFGGLSPALDGDILRDAVPL